MPKFEWEDKLSVGVKEMDDQHKIIIQKINALVDAMDSKDFLKIRTAFDSLATFTVKHFKEEEEMMEKSKFEGIATHKIIHQQLLSQVGEFDKQVSDKTLVPAKLEGFLRVWLTSHIMGIDKKYSACCSKKAA